MSPLPARVTMTGMEGSDPGASRCADCGAEPSRIHLDGVPLCEGCFDARISEGTGWPRLPPPPPPEIIRGPDGRRHRIAYRVWRSPGGISVEAEEEGRSEGYAARLVIPHEGDPTPAVERVRAAIRRRIGHLHLDRTSGSGNLIMSGDELRGRLVWRAGGMPYGVVVDGRELSWEEFGLALEPFEGWEFRLRIVEGHDDEDDVGAGGGTARPSTIFEPPPDRHAH